MKKSVALVLAIGTLFAFGACGKEETKTNQFIALEKEETLFVGLEDMFKNYETEITTKSYLTYEAEVTYTLNRSYYTLSNNIKYVYYYNYYYYWTTDSRKEEDLLGNKTVKVSYTYSYLPYGSEGENLAVRVVRNVQTKYDYESGYVTKPRIVNTELNGYFTTLSGLSSLCPDLAKLIDGSKSKQYYVDATTPDYKDADTEMYTNTYFYIE